MLSSRDRQVIKRFAGQSHPGNRLLSNWSYVGMYLQRSKSDTTCCWLCPQGLQRGFESFTWINKATKSTINLGKECHYRMCKLVKADDLPAANYKRARSPPRLVRVDLDDEEEEIPRKSKSKAKNPPRAVSVEDEDDEVEIIEVQTDVEYDPEEDEEDEDSEEESEAEEEPEETEEEPEYKDLPKGFDLDSYEWEYKEILEEGKYDSLVSYWPVRCSEAVATDLCEMFEDSVEDTLHLSDGSVIIYWKPTMTSNDSIRN